MHAPYFLRLMLYRYEIYCGIYFYPYYYVDGLQTFSDTVRQGHQNHFLAERHYPVVYLLLGYLFLQFKLVRLL